MRLAAVLVLAAGCGRIGFVERGVDDGSLGDDAPAANGFAHLVAYGDNTCATYRGVAYCWGENNGGQIGDGTTMRRGEPRRVNIPDGVTALALGESHACAIVASTAMCWGVQFGIMSQTPAVVSFNAVVVDIAAGKKFTCAVTNGTAHCWGLNDAGQLGDATLTSRANPMPIASAEPIVAIDAGDDHACARTANTTALCWGHNDDGTLGTGSFDPQTSETPVTVTGGITTLPRIAGWHACTLRGSEAWCWGRNTEGALGDGSVVSKPSPQRVPNLDAVSLVATGGGPSDFDATCAIRMGEVYCWGNGNDGRLGNGGTTLATQPVKTMTLPAAAIDVAMGYGHACALLVNGDVWCWGRGGVGQLGNGALTNSLTPVRVTPPPGGA